MLRLELIGKRHPLSGTDWKGESSSDTQQSTSTTTSDNRVGADNGSVVIQAGGQQNISFSPEVATAASSIVNAIVDFSGNVLTEARTIVNESMMVQQQVLEGALEFGKSSLAASPATPAAASQNISAGQQTSTLKPVYIIGAIGGIALLFMFLKRK